MKAPRIWVSVLSCFFCVQVFALSTVTLGPSTGSVTDTLDVPIRFNADDRIVALQADILYDPSTFSFSTVTAGAALGSHALEFNLIRPGQVRVVVTSIVNALLPNGALFHLEGNLLTDSSSTNALSLASIILANESGLSAGYALSPFIALVGPSPQGTLNAGEVVQIEAIAVSQGASIEEVEIFVNGQSLGLFAEGPFVVSWTPMEAGQALLTAVVRSSGGLQSTAEALNLTVAGVGIAGLNDWLDANFTPAQLLNPAISGLFVDPDLDGLLNIFEYATGTLPLAYTPKTDLPQTLLIDSGENTYLALRYRLRANVTDIVAQVQASDHPDFPLPSTMDAVVVESLLFGDYFLNTERDPVPVGQTTAMGGRYIRLLITEAQAPAP